MPYNISLADIYHSIIDFCKHNLRNYEPQTLPVTIKSKLQFTLDHNATCIT